MSGLVPLLALAVALALGQQPPSLFAPQPQRLSATGRADVERVVPGRPFTLLIDATPAPGIHVYAPGNKDYVAVELTLAASAGMRAGSPVYPPGEPWIFGELRELVQVYKGPFQVRVPVTLSSKAATGLEAITITVSLRYQPCTEKVCFPPATLPIGVTLPLATRKAR